VLFFENRNVPLAINHCVSLYPSEDHQLELAQIDYLKERYPGHVIGFSSHEYNDWQTSMAISYAKGARTWERHIDIDYNNASVSNYCSLPHQVDTWFKAFYKAIEMCGPKNSERRNISKKEIEYLDKLVRGIYARKDLEKGYTFNSKNLKKDFFLAIPLLKGQLSCREVLNGEMLKKDLKKDSPLLIDDIDGPYSDNENLNKLIKNRGLKI
jgi:N-acetylneuraminate synthase